MTSGISGFDAIPSRRPAEQLREELALDRRAGLSFDQCFTDEVDYICSAVTPQRDAKQWRIAFDCTRPIWRAAYERTQPAVSHLSVDLIAA